MKAISNEEKAQEKAKELAISATKYVNDKGEEVYNVFCEAACMQMHEWTKQQMIEMACKEHLQRLQLSW